MTTRKQHITPSSIDVGCARQDDTFCHFFAKIDTLFSDKTHFKSKEYIQLFSFCFNAKEKDYESGFHYYGARYYDSEVLTGWLSVDPMMDQYPSISPYAYCVWNPVKLVDPDGNESMECDDWWKSRNSNSDGSYSLFYNSISGIQGETLELNGEIYDWVGNSDQNSPPIDEYGIPKEKCEGSYYSSAPWIGHANKELMDKKNNHESPKGSNKGGHIDMYMESCGLTEGYSWCAGFVNWCLEASGFEGGGARGGDYKKWPGGNNIGNIPEYGSIAIFKTGHVGFVIGTTNDGNIDVIHGNWSDRIQRNNYIKMSEIDCFVRPIQPMKTR